MSCTYPIQSWWHALRKVVRRLGKYSERGGEMHIFERRAVVVLNSERTLGRNQKFACRSIGQIRTMKHQFKMRALVKHSGCIGYSSINYLGVHIWAPKVGHPFSVRRQILMPLIFGLYYAWTKFQAKRQYDLIQSSSHL